MDAIVTQSEAQWIITKASVGKDGVRRWVATPTEFKRDIQNDLVTRAFYEEAAKRIKSGAAPPPFLSIAHYGRHASAGEATDVYIDGNRPKARGVFESNKWGDLLFKAVRHDIKGRVSEKERIRISMAFFPDPDGVEVKSLGDKGKKGRDFTKGWIEHFAATRVPVVPSTDISIEEKSMDIRTKKDDAASIVGPEAADEIEKGEVQKSGLVVKASPSVLVRPAMQCPQCKSAVIPAGEADCPECAHVLNEAEVEKAFPTAKTGLKPGEVLDEGEGVSEATSEGNEPEGNKDKPGQVFEGDSTEQAQDIDEAEDIEDEVLEPGDVLDEGKGKKETETKHLPFRHDQQSHAGQRGAAKGTPLSESTAGFEVSSSIKGEKIVREPDDRAPKPGTAEFADAWKKEIAENNAMPGVVERSKGTVTLNSYEQAAMWDELMGQMSDGKYENALRRNVASFFSLLKIKVDPTAKLGIESSAFRPSHRNVTIKDLKWLFTKKHAYGVDLIRGSLSYYNNDQLDSLMETVASLVNGTNKSATEEDVEYSASDVIDALKKRNKRRQSQKIASEAKGHFGKPEVEEVESREEEATETSEEEVAEDKKQKRRHRVDAAPNEMVSAVPMGSMPMGDMKAITKGDVGNAPDKKQVLDTISKLADQLLEIARAVDSMPDVMVSPGVSDKSGDIDEETLEDTEEARADEGEEEVEEVADEGEEEVEEEIEDGEEEIEEEVEEVADEEAEPELPEFDTGDEEEEIEEEPASKKLPFPPKKKKKNPFTKSEVKLLTELVRGTANPVKTRVEASAVVKALVADPVDALLNEFVSEVRPSLKSRAMDRRAKLRIVQKSLNELAEGMQELISETTSPSGGDIAEITKTAVDEGLAEIRQSYEQRLDALSELVAQVVKSQPGRFPPPRDRRSIGDPVTAHVRKALTQQGQGEVAKSEAASLGVIVGPTLKALSAGEVAERSVRQGQAYPRFY